MFSSLQRDKMAGGSALLILLFCVSSALHSSPRVDAAPAPFDLSDTAKDIRNGSLHLWNKAKEFVGLQTTPRTFTNIDDWNNPNHTLNTPTSKKFDLSRAVTAVRGFASHGWNSLKDTFNRSTETPPTDTEKKNPFARFWSKTKKFFSKSKPTTTVRPTFVVPEDWVRHGLGDTDSFVTTNKREAAAFVPERELSSDDET